MSATTTAAAAATMATMASSSTIGLSSARGHCARKVVAAASSSSSAAAAAAAAVMSSPPPPGWSNDVKIRQTTYMARLILRMEDCLVRLGVLKTRTTFGRENNVPSSSSNNSGGDDDDHDGNVVAATAEQRDDAIMQQLERMAILIHESMSTSSRNYHSVQHVFDVSNNLRDPKAVLAALFHDCIYYHVDGGLSSNQMDKLRGTVLCESGQLEAHTTTHSESDPLLSMVEHIFGYADGQVVSHQDGLNEFLSAVICVRELQNLLDRKVLAELACCIEATIPFRPRDGETGETAMDRLHRNMVHTNERFQLNMNDAELVEAVQRACLLANEDVGNFGTTDRAWFLDNTWSLLPESNESLRNRYLYTAKEFQFAVYKMHKFFRFLTADVIFQSFRGVPAADDVAAMQCAARRNLSVGRTYVDCKLLSASVLAAFAELTGGDAPMSLFMGDLPGRHRVSTRLEDALPDAAPAAAATTSSTATTVQPRGVLPPATATATATATQSLREEDNNDNDNVGNDDNDNENDNDNDIGELFDIDVYNLLKYGRRCETAFDVRQSPLAAYLYSTLGDAGLQDLLSAVSPLYPMTADAARKLLTMLPRSAVTLVANKMAQVAFSRCEPIKNVLSNLN